MAEQLIRPPPGRYGVYLASDGVSLVLYVLFWFSAGCLFGGRFGVGVYLAAERLEANLRSKKQHSAYFDRCLFGVRPRVFILRPNRVFIWFSA